MKRLLAFVLVLTMILGTVVIPAWANTTDVSTGSLYAIPNDATQVTLGGEVYTVLRNLDDVKAAFPTTSVNRNQNYILAADIDCTGTTFEGNDILIPAGTVLEGNGFGFINVTEKNGFLSFQYGDEIVIRNAHFGTKSNPIEIRSDKDGNYGGLAVDTFAVIRWENCQFYTGVYCPTGRMGGLFGGNPAGQFTFIGCLIESKMEVGCSDTGIIASRCSGGMLTLILKDVDIYGYIKAIPNGTTDINVGSIIGWASGDIYAENCNNYANITGMFTGGFIGNSSPSPFTVTFKNCKNYGAINSTPTPGHIGGFIGQSRLDFTTFENCVNFGRVSAGACTGGFVGFSGVSGMKAINCLNVGRIVGGTLDTGGIIGQGYGVFEDCINIGTIVGPSNAGNIIGKGHGNITNCYGLGKITNGIKGALNATGNAAETVAFGNKHLGSFTYDTYISTNKDTDAITQEDAIAVLEEKYPEYKFVAENDGSISISQTYLRAVQHTAAADGKFNVRILGTISSLNQLKVGFQGTVSYTENGTPMSKNITIENSGTNRVHKAILAGENVVSAEDLMGAYIYTLKLENLPATGKITIELAPVSVIAGETEDTVIVGTTTTLIYQDGVFAGTEGDDETGTIITLPAYTDADTPTELDPDADKDHPYDIPETATTYMINGVEYKVIRTFDEWEKALARREVKVTVGSGFNKKEHTYYYTETLHLILADTLDGEGKTVAPETWFLGGGSVIEGNGYSIINYNGFDVFKIEPAIKPEDNTTEVTDKVVVQNLDFGCEDLLVSGFATALPEKHTSMGMLCASTNISTEWNNCNLYGELFSTLQKAYFGGWFGIVEGDHSFIDCSFNGVVAAHGFCAGFIAKIDSAESKVIFDGCENNADVYGLEDTAGFIAVTAPVGTSGKVTIKDSVNTGDAWGGEIAGGFIGSGSSVVLIENSGNYGDVTAASRYASAKAHAAGGFIGSVNNPSNGVATTTIVNSVNYGTIVGNACSAGGVIGTVGTPNQQYANPVELQKVTNFGTINSTYRGGGMVGRLHGTSLTVTEALNVGEVYSVHASGIVGEIDKGTEINLEVCANVGKITEHVAGSGATKMRQHWSCSVSNIGGMASAMPDDTNTPTKDESGKITIKNCYALGELVPSAHSSTTGMLVAIGSIVTEFEENSFAHCSDFELADDMLIGIDNIEPYTLAEAAEVLATIFTNYSFTVVEDAIVVAPAQNG